MVSAVRGPVTFEGPQEFVDIGLAVMDALVVPAEKLLLAPTRCVFLPALTSGPKWAEGVYRGSRRTAEVRTMRRADGKPRYARVFYTAAHELFGHGADHDCMDGKRRVAMALMSPQPTRWAGGHGKTGMARYWQYPFENYANRMAEAVTGHKAVSPYDDDYTRPIDDADLAALVDLTTVGVPNPADHEPPPPTVDDGVDADALAAEIARLNALLVECGQQLADTRATLAQREAAFTEAKRLAAQIGELV